MKTQTTHTPGQWETGALITQVEIWPTGWNVPMLIADCHGRHSPESELERVANARLIAAAPDLLTALAESADALDAICAGIVDLDKAKKALRSINGRNRHAIALALGGPNPENPATGTQGTGKGVLTQPLTQAEKRHGADLAEALGA